MKSIKNVQERNWACALISPKTNTILTAEYFVLIIMIIFSVLMLTKV